MEEAALAISNKIRGLATIDSINIEGNKRIETDAILASIESQKGAIFRPEQLDKDLKSIYQMGFFEDVQINVEEGHKGKNITFKLSEKPSVGKIKFKGNKKIEQKDLMDVLGIKKYTILNRKEINDSIERLRDHYHQKGYYNVVVKYTVEELSDNEVVLVYRIKEGDKVTISKIVFIGNAEFSDDDLRDVMDTNEKGFFSFLTNSGHLDRKTLESDIFKIKSFYSNNGYIKARVGEPKISFKKDEGILIAITINEGPQYAIRHISIKGDLIKENVELYKTLSITKEKVYNREAVRTDTLTLSEIYSDEGYAFVDIYPEIKEDDKAHRVDIVYHISKGKKVKFERIIITGNDKTRDKVIRRELKVVEGGYFSGGKLKRSSQNIQRLGFFEEMELNTKRGSTKEDMILNIHINQLVVFLCTVGVPYC
jgi:outer membrane protein insertion porin family